MKIKPVITAGVILLIILVAGRQVISRNKLAAELKKTDVSPTKTVTGVTAINEADKTLAGKIKLADGYEIRYFSDDVPGARSMTIGPAGTIYVGTKDTGNVYALTDENQDGKADKRVIVGSNLDSPNGVAVQNGDLYVAENSRIIKYADIENNFRNKPKFTVVYDKLPRDRHHGWKYIAFGPDGKLYIPIGAPCNICKIDDPYATINRINADGSGWEVYARGVRNTVGFAWNPADGTLWFTDNGRDLLGDNLPTDELNRIEKMGQHFGYPFCHQGNLPDPEYGKGKSCDDYAPPQINLAPHGAALGMKFIDNKIFIAEHGSWNRKVPIGYRVSTVELVDGKATNYQTFAEGWLEDNGQAWGRPVDILEIKNGDILVSDDKQGVIYRISKAGR